ncbi:hypothetical protein [Streptomyces sp. NBC_00091]|uniref:SCO2583 family membrane protein n=1 Tax=Streptomyces sp. NBC_00091 TaxID=2975648 RepID=UPI00224CCF0F|nr:hypothetical protein [Streptomyces sp. NBC_00091]MCX5378391.1 hypothetical protein [Streptomyces sp. NBC_00091]
MAVPGDPPDGTPDGIGGGDDELRPDEYRSVVFDEDFVRAARLQEFSAQERMGEHARAVRSRSIWAGGGPAGPRTGTPGRGARQGMLLVLLIATAFAIAVYMGMRNPYVPPAGGNAEPLSSTVVPLAPASTVPGGRPADLYANSPAAEYRVGAAGITLPAVRRTHHFTEGQVVAALSIAKDYLVQSSLDPDVLSGAASRPVRVLLDPGQLAQFDESVAAPSGDGRHAVTGWLVRFDPATVVADSRVRVSGTLAFQELNPEVLEVSTDHTFVYAVRAAAGPPATADGASLFTVRRELRLRFDREDLTARRAELSSAYVMAGPQDCATEPAEGFRPLPAGAGPTTVGPPASDPYASGHPRRTAGLCGVLAPPGAPTTPPAQPPAPPPASVSPVP